MTNRRGSRTMSLPDQRLVFNKGRFHSSSPLPPKRHGNYTEDTCMAQPQPLLPPPTKTIPKQNLANRITRQRSRSALTGAKVVYGGGLEEMGIGDKKTGGHPTREASSLDGVDARLNTALQELQSIKKYYVENDSTTPRSARGKEGGSVKEGGSSASVPYIEVTADKSDAERLKTAEEIMRKLYRRNLALEEQLKRAQQQQQHTGAITSVKAAGRDVACSDKIMGGAVSELTESFQTVFSSAGSIRAAAEARCQAATAVRRAFAATTDGRGSKRGGDGESAETLARTAMDGPSDAQGAGGGGGTAAAAAAGSTDAWLSGLDETTGAHDLKGGDNVGAGGGEGDEEPVVGMEVLRRRLTAAETRARDAYVQFRVQQQEVVLLRQERQMLQEELQEREGLHARVEECVKKLMLYVQKLEGDRGGESP